MRNQSENWPTELGTLKFLTRTERFGEVFGGFGLPPPQLQLRGSPSFLPSPTPPLPLRKMTVICTLNNNFIKVYKL